MADCVITGSLLNGNNLPAPNVKFWAKKLVRADLITDVEQKLAGISDAAGVLRGVDVDEVIIPASEGATFPQGSTVTLEGNFYVNGVSFVAGVAVTIPVASTATLISLVAAATFPDDGAIVQQTGTALPHLIGTFNFGSGITVTESSTGVALITAAAAVVTAEEVQDALSTFFTDSGAYDWNYNDALNKVELVIAPATTSVNGLMSAADKTAFDLIGARNAANGYAGLSAGGLLTESQIPSSIARDSEVTALTDALTTALTGKSDVGHTHTFASLTSKPTTLAGYGITDAAAIATSGSASDLSTGTIPDARFPATLPAASGANLTALNAGNISSGILATARGGFGVDMSAASGVSLWAAGVPTLTSTSGTGNFARVTSPTFVTPVLGVATSTSLTAGAFLSLSSGGSFGQISGLNATNGIWLISGANANGNIVVKANGSSIDYLGIGSSSYVAFSSLGGGYQTIDAILSRNAAGVLQVGTTSNNALGKLDCAEYRIAGVKVVSTQGAAVADATDGPSAITQLNLLLARARAHGLIAT